MIILLTPLSMCNRLSSRSITEMQIESQKFIS